MPRDGLQRRVRGLCRSFSFFNGKTNPQSDGSANILHDITFPPSIAPSRRTNSSVEQDDDNENDYSLFIMGGKSNKFDYSNRPNSGKKLGEYIGRDLVKEADKAENDSVKQAAKARKTSSSSTVSGLSSSSATTVVHPLDIKAPGKNLGDDGACELADGLLQALMKASANASVLLEDLNISNNGITTVTLARLAPAIELARYDLKTINVANNNIKVETDVEAQQWETFLRAFKNCYKLRRLDLRGNVQLGARALEVLARVHIEEPLIDSMPSWGDTSVISLPTGEVDLAGSEEDLMTPTSAYFTNNMTRGKFVKRRCGLRSIPYVTLNDTGLTDAGALWLSHVLEDHHFPSQLIDELNAIPPESTIRTYQQDAELTGIDWDEREPAIGKDGVYLLKKVEAIRKQTMLEAENVDGMGHFTDNVSLGEEVVDPSPVRKSIDRRTPRSQPGDRRASIRSIRTADGGEHELSEVESVRKKIQRQIIAHQGTASVELWRAGLHIAISSTILRGLGPDPGAVRRYYIGPPMWHLSDSIQSDSLPVTPIDQNQGMIAISIDSAKTPPMGGEKSGTYATTLTDNAFLTPGEPELAITEVTNSPQTPKLIFKQHRKGAFSDGSDSQAATQKDSDIQEVTRKLDELIVRHDVGSNPLRFVKWQENHGADVDGPDGFRNSAIRSHFPTKIMEHIAALTVTDRERELLSAKQKRAAVAWGQDRATFQIAESWHKMADSAQAWTLLESIGCLAYQKE